MNVGDTEAVGVYEILGRELMICCHQREFVVNYKAYENGQLVAEHPMLEPMSAEQIIYFFELLLSEEKVREDDHDPS